MRAEHREEKQRKVGQVGLVMDQWGGQLIGLFTSQKKETANLRTKHLRMFAAGKELGVWGKLWGVNSPPSKLTDLRSGRPMVQGEGGHTQKGQSR